MPSSLTWLDFSEHERRQAERIIALFEDKGTVDQLGVGTIRDAIADLLFPGASVIQTRARYFLFIPWAYLSLERSKVPAAEFGARAQRNERRLIRALLDAGETTGVIGRVAGERVKILPSAIYWQGLGTWGIRRFSGSQRQYHRWVDRYYRLLGAAVQTDDKDLVDGVAPRNWHPGIPPAREGFPEGAALALTRAEAEYLRERICLTCQGTMLAFLVRDGKPAEPTEGPWMHPQLAELPVRVRQILEHGRVFSDVMHGAALLYNLMLARAKQDEERVAEYEADFATWATETAAMGGELRQWSENSLWALLDGASARIPEPTRRFVTSWFTLARAATPQLADQADALRLLRERERLLKGALARLENQRALDLWRGASGVQPLTYRWPVVQDIVGDIHQGLAR